MNPVILKMIPLGICLSSRVLVSIVNKNGENPSIILQMAFYMIISPVCCHQFVQASVLDFVYSVLF